MILRFITGFALLGVGIVVIWQGGLWFLAWVWLVAMLNAYEMFGMAKKKHPTINPIPAYLFISAMLLSVLHPTLHGLWNSWVGQLLSLGMLSFCILELFNKKVYAFDTPLSSTIRIALFVGILFPYIYLLRDGQQGLVHLWFVLLNIWACDVFALFGGKLVGKTQLSALSPKKTVEGSIIGLIMCLAMAAILIVILHLPIVSYLFLSLIVGILSQLGDLHESLIKRHFDSKDSSQLLPGHGGFYDRADSTIFACPPSYFLLNGIL